MSRKLAIGTPDRSFMSRQDHRNSAESRYNASAHDLTVNEPLVSWKSDKNVNDHRIMPGTISFTGVSTIEPVDRKSEKPCATLWYLSSRFRLYESLTREHTDVDLDEIWHEFSFQTDIHIFFYRQWPKTTLKVIWQTYFGNYRRWRFCVNWWHQCKILTTEIYWKNWRTRNWPIFIILVHPCRIQRNLLFEIIITSR